MIDLFEREEKYEVLENNIETVHQFIQENI